MTTYVYDADNELISEQFGGTGQTPLRIDMTYDADGEILTETRYSNLAGTQVVVESSYTYNADGEITSILDDDGSGTTVADFTYTYDADGLRDQRNRPGGDHDLHLRRRQRVDQRDLVTDEDQLHLRRRRQPDRRRHRDRPGQPAPLRRDLELHLRRRRQPDREGRGRRPARITGMTWTYTYNNQNQMTSAVETQGSTTLETVTYTYDVFGNRIEEDVDNSGQRLQVTRFAYDGQNIWADLDGNNNLVTRRLFLDTVDAPVARISASGTVAWYLTDRLGSVRVLTDNTGAVIDQINYDGYRQHHQPDQLRGQRPLPLDRPAVRPRSPACNTTGRGTTTRPPGGGPPRTRSGSREGIRTSIDM